MRPTPRITFFAWVLVIAGLMTTSAVFWLVLGSLAELAVFLAARS